MTVYTKPKIVCLLLHQFGWEDYEDGDEGIQYCPYCKRSFYYPSKKDHHPVYKKER